MADPSGAEPGPRSSLETGELLRAAVQRAGKIRTDLAALREEAFIAAAAAASAQSSQASTPRGQSAAAGPLQLVLPPAAAAAGRPHQAPVVLPVVFVPQQHRQQTAPKGLSLLSAGGSSGLHGPHPASSPGGLPPAAGELQAGPKSSGGGGSSWQVSGGSGWSIPAARGQPQQAARPEGLPLWSPAHLAGPPAPSTAAAAAAGSAAGGSFEDVLAALQAEGALQPLPNSESEGDEQAVGLQGGSPAKQRRLPPPRGSTASAADSLLSGGQLRSGRAAGAGGGRTLPHTPPGAHSQRHLAGAAAGGSARRQQPLPTFDQAAAERELKDKMDEVNAAKRRSYTRRQHGGAASSASARASPAPSGLPRLPLASLSRAGSCATSPARSMPPGSRENEQQHGQQQRQVQRGRRQPSRSPVRGARAASEQAEAAAAALGGFNFLPLAREDPSSRPQQQRRQQQQQSPSPTRRGHAAGVAEAGAPQRSARKQSHVSLSDLLETSSRGASGASMSAQPSAASGSVRLRHSSFSVPDATSAAAAGAGAAATAASPAPPSAGAACGELPASAEFVPICPPSAAGQTAAPAAAVAAAALAPVAAAVAAAETAVPAAGVAANVQPGEAAAPPLHYTPRAPSEQGQAPGSVGGERKQGGMVSRLLGKLASPFGKLQSPPATPLDAPATGGKGAQPEVQVPPGTEASASSSSSGQASTASSGSPEQREQQQQQQGQAQQLPPSPFRSFPVLGGSPPKGEAGQALQHQPEQQPAPQPQQPEQQPAPQPQQPEQQPAQQPQQLPSQQQEPLRAAPSADRSASRLATAGSASSIGRKRSNSEVGAVEQPASVKKHSPEMGSRLLARSAGEDWGSCGAAAASALEAAAGPAQLAAGPLAAVADTADAPELQHGQPVAQPQAPLPAPAEQAAPALPAAAAHGAAPVSASRVVLPVVLEHSPGRQRRQAQPQRRLAPPSTPRPAAATQQPAAPAQAAAGAQHRQPAPVQQQQQQQQQTAPAPIPQHHRHQQEQGGRRPPGIPRLPVAKAQAVPAAAAPATAEEPELPSHSSWVASPREQQQAQAVQPGGQPELPSHSVLLGAHGAGTAAALAAAPPVYAPCSARTSAAGSPLRCPTTLPASELAAAAAAAAAAATAVPGITPRRRASSLEPNEAAAPSLRHDSHGRALLAVAPELADQPAGALLDAMRQGCLVRKAWVRPNFKIGGSMRRLQLAPGTGGRADMLYPSGLFRKPLRFAVRRAVVNCPAWRPGAYLVLDSARGMLRLEPATAAEHSRWVLALNAAFLASGAAPAGGSSGGAAAGGDGTLAALGDQRWSAAILFG